MGRIAEDLAPRRKPARVSIGTSPPTEYIAHVPEQGHVARATAGADVLYAAATDLLRASDSPAVLGAAVRYARKLLSTDIAFAMLLDPARNLLRLEASVGHRTPTFTTIVRPVQAVTAVGSGRPVQSSDFLNDSRLDHDPPTDDIIRKEGMRTVLAVPLRYGEQTLGALYVGNRKPRYFPAGEVDILLALADHVSSALANAQRYSEVALRLDRSTRSLRESESERSLLVQAEEVRRAVSHRTKEQEGVTAVAVTLGECLDRPVLVTDWKLTVIVNLQGRSNPNSTRLTAAFLNRAESREAVAICNETHRPTRVGADWLVAPIEAGRNLLGYLWVGPSETGNSDLVEIAMDRVMPIVALELLTKGDAERRQGGDFIYELLSERLPDFSVLEARAAQVWSYYVQPHRPVILNIGGVDDQWGVRLEIARRLVAAARPNDFATVYGRHLVLLVTPMARDHVEAALSDIRLLLERNRLSATAVVGGPCRNLRESREGTLAALRLHELLGTNGILWAEGLESLTQLFEPTQKERLAALCRAALAPLARREGLMDALHAYYEAGGNKANAARRLSVHVNTLRQRLERTEQLIGGSVDDSIRAVPLRLALLVREVVPEVTKNLV